VRSGTKVHELCIRAQGTDVDGIREHRHKRRWGGPAPQLLAQVECRHTREGHESRAWWSQRHLAARPSPFTCKRRVRWQLVVGQASVVQRVSERELLRWRGHCVMGGGGIAQVVPTRHGCVGWQLNYQDKSAACMHNTYMATLCMRIELRCERWSRIMCAVPT
jgi:hypothetical protein